MATDNIRQRAQPTIQPDLKEIPTEFPRIKSMLARSLLTSQKERNSRYTSYYYVPKISFLSLSSLSCVGLKTAGSPESSKDFVSPLSIPASALDAR